MGAARSDRLTLSPPLCRVSTSRIENAATEAWGSRRGASAAGNWGATCAKGNLEGCTEYGFKG